jgi:Porin subfamily
MSNVKTFLLVGTASLCVATAAAAADLPSKARPVQYVKVCDGYGAGYYTIPGTDTCIKIGGYLRYELDYNAGGTFTPDVSGPQARYNRATDSLVSRARAFTSFDVRTATEYGTLRSYARTAIQWTSNDAVTAGSGAVAYIDRAFLQFANVTAGRAQSAFDLYSFSVHSFQTNIIGSDSGGTGTNLLTYTLPLGNGWTAAVSAEEQKMRSRAVANLNNPGNFVPGATPVFNNAGQSVPDVVTNLRVDQAWGSAQIMGALHEVAAQYYAGNGTANTPCGAFPGGTPANNITSCGHPDNKLGWAAGAGLFVNLPWTKGDTAGVQVNYASGALAYVGMGAGANGGQSFQIFNGNNLALGFVTDGVFANQSDIELTTGWSITAGAEHYWTPALRSSLYGGFMSVHYGDGARNLICRATPAQIGFGPVSNCDPDVSFWQVGSRTVWNPVRDLDLGIEVLYNRVNTAFAGTATLLANNGPQPAGQYSISDQGAVSAIFRVQRNFLP